MKNVLIITLLIILILFSVSGFAQDYMKWGIPENATLRLGKGSIYDIKHSPNGDLIAVASSIGVWLYDADSGKEIRLLQKHTDWVNSLAFSPNGKMLASCGPDGIHLWETYTGHHLSTLNESPADTRNVVFSPDGRTLISTNDKIIRFWDVTNGSIAKTLTGHTWQILSLAISPNGKTIVSGSHVQDELQQSNGLRWWDVETGRTMFYSTNVDSVTALSFSPNGKILACADGQKIHLFDGVNGKILRTLPGHQQKTTTLTFSPDGKLLVSSGWDNIIHLWDPRSGDNIHIFRGHTSGVKASFLPDGETLVSGSGDGTIRYWDISTKRQRFSIFGHWNEINALAFSTDNKTLLSGTSQATIHKWDVGTGQLKSTLVGHDGETILAFDMSGKLFASKGAYREKNNDKIYIRFIDTGRLLTSMELDISLLTDEMILSHDGRTLVSTSLLDEKGKINFWNAEPFNQHLEFEFIPYENPEFRKHNLIYKEVGAFASSPDGKLLAIATSGGVSLWKFGTKTFIQFHPAPRFYVCDTLAFSQDSKTLAIGDSSHVRLIEVDTGHLITTLSKHNRGVSALAFSPNDKILASGSRDGTIFIWDLEKTIKGR